MLSGNDEITRLNSDITTTTNLVVSSRLLHVLTYANNPFKFPCCNITLKHDWTILLFYQSCSIMLTLLLQGCWANNPPCNSLWYFYLFIYLLVYIFIYLCITTMWGLTCWAYFLLQSPKNAGNVLMKILKKTTSKLFFKCGIFVDTRYLIFRLNWT